MNAQNLAKKLVVGIALVCFFTSYVRADKLELQAKLSKQAKIEMRDVTIVEALEKIGKKADVKIVLSDEAAWKLPQGEATRLSVMMQGPLADSMTEMLNAFFMRYAVGDKEITIYPRPELDHILGRPTTKQLELLKAIYTKTTKTYRSAKEIISEALGQEVLVLPVTSYNSFHNFMRELAVEVPAADGTPSQELAVPVTVAQLLGSVKSTWSWYISPMDFPNQIPEIRVVRDDDFWAAKLDQVVDISFKDQEAQVIIQRLAKRVGAQLIIRKEAPSWLQERISLDMQNVKLRQALLNVVTTMDGEIRFGKRDIFNQGPRHREEPVAPKGDRSKSGDYVGKISIPMEGGAYYIEFMLREKDLTDELKKLWQEKMKEILKVPTYELAPAAEPQPTDKTQEMQEVR